MTNKIKPKNKRIVPSNKPRLLVVIEGNLKTDFEKLCKVEKRSMSNMVNVLIEEAINKARKEGKI